MALCCSYFDASGKNRWYPAMVVSGFVATTKKWQRIAMSNALRLEVQMVANPQEETFQKIMREWVSLHRSAPNAGDFLLYGRDRMEQNCVMLGIPRRSEKLSAGEGVH